MSNKSIFTVVCVVLLAFTVWGNYNLQQQNNILKQTQESDRQASCERDSDAFRSIEQLSEDKYKLEKQLTLWESGINPADLRNVSKPATRQSHSFSTGKKVVRVAADHKPGEDEVIIQAGAPEE